MHYTTKYTSKNKGSFMRLSIRDHKNSIWQTMDIKTILIFKIKHCVSGFNGNST